MLTVGSLFSGIGGFDLGLERAGMSIKWQVENNDYCNKVLAKHWPTVRQYGDITKIDWGTVEPVDLICGGFPCQDLSYAGKRAGLAGKRSGLWSEYVRAIRALRPQYVLVENVPGLLTNEYMGRVLGDLAESGYDAEWQVLSAATFRAPHLRERVWILAYDNSKHSEEYFFRDQLQKTSRQTPSRWSDLSNFWGTIHQPAVGGVAHGVPHRVDRLRGLGNAVVPQIVEALGRMILESERQMATC